MSHFESCRRTLCQRVLSVIIGIIRALRHYLPAAICGTAFAVYIRIDQELVN